MIQEKVRRLFPDKNDEEVLELSSELTNHGEILAKFENLLVYVDDVVESIQEQNALMSEFHSLEREKARERAKQGVANVCHLPVKLRLSKLQRTWALSHSFTSLLRYEYGPLHAALEVGNITLEWGQESLIVPGYDPSGALFAAHVHDQGEWFDETYKLVKDMSLADRCKDRRRKIEILNNSAEKKEELLKKLADVIIDYNLNKKYNVYSCNCQHFVLDALAALGIKEPPEFSGRLKEYLEALKKGKPHTADKFEKHEQLDIHVKTKLNLGDISTDTHDAEYLLCQYFQFHLPSIEASEDEENWQCEVPNCQCKALEEWVKDRNLLLNQFLKENTPQVSKQPTVPPIPEEEEYVYEAPQEGNGQVQDQVNGGGQDGEEDLSVVLAKQLAGDTDQGQIFSDHSGYSERISHKVKTKFAASKTETERAELAEILASAEGFRAKYLARTLDKTVEQLTMSASNDFKRVQNHQLPRNEARRLSVERFQTVSNLSIKLLLRTQPQSRRGSILDAPLQAYLHFENLVLRWDDSSLIVPSEASTLLDSQPVFKANLHLSEWSTFVSKQEPRRQSAIDQTDGGLEVELIVELNEKRDTLVSKLLRVIVDYNRNKFYNDRRCNNQHFIHDVCRAVGIKAPPEICVTFKQQLSKLKPSRRLSRRNFTKHEDLDAFVREEIQNRSIVNYKPYDLDFLIGQYFRLHIACWDEMEGPRDQWKCEVENCQLEELEKHKPKFESSWCTLL